MYSYISIRFDSVSKGRPVKGSTIQAGRTLRQRNSAFASFRKLTCTRSQQNAYANYHFPRSSKRRCYYCSYLTDEISKTLRFMYARGACPKPYLPAAHVHHKITIVSSNAFPPLLYAHISRRLYSRNSARVRAREYIHGAARYAAWRTFETFTFQEHAF